MFLGINMFWALLRAYFNSHLMAQAKMSSELGPKHIYTHEHKLCCFNNGSENVMKVAF